MSRAGQPLIRLDDRDFRAAADRAAAIVEARKATLDSLERKQTLQQTADPPGEGRPRRQDRAGGLRQAGRPTLSRPCADRRRIAAKRRAGVVAQPGGRGQRGFVRGRARRREATARRFWTRRSPSPRPTSPRPRPISTRPNSISATPIFARRSTAMSAIAPRRSAPMSRAAPISSRSSRRMTFGSTPISRKASSSICVRDRRRRSSPTSCRATSSAAMSLTLAPGDRRHLQRDPAGERDRQLHQDRSARSRPHQARRRPDARAVCGPACRQMSASTRDQLRATRNDRRGHPLDGRAVRRDAF